MIGTLLGTKEAKLISQAAIARAKQAPYDATRIDLFWHYVIIWPLMLHTLAPGKNNDSIANLAFYEAYFSNFIEGTEFLVEEAHEIIFEGKIPLKTQGAHDIIGTYRLVANDKEMNKVSKTADAP